MANFIALEQDIVSFDYKDNNEQNLHSSAEQIGHTLWVLDGSLNEIDKRCLYLITKAWELLLNSQLPQGEAELIAVDVEKAFSFS